MKLDRIPGGKSSLDANEVNRESSRRIEFKSQLQPSVEAPLSEWVPFARPWGPSELILETIQKNRFRNPDQIYEQLKGTEPELVALRQIDSCAEQAHVMCCQIAPIMRGLACARMLIRSARPRGPLAKNGIKWLGTSQ
jgi:hypothetical protein